MNRYYRLICFLLSVCAAVFLQGCGLIGILGTESASEKKIPAQYSFNVGNQKKVEPGQEKKILVLVNQPSFINAPPILRQILTEQIQARLIMNAKLKAANFISYQALSDYRSKEPGFYSMTAGEIGKALKADWVLVADLTGYKMINSIEETNYFGGALTGKVFVIETASGYKVWPTDSEGRDINVGFDVEKKGSEYALIRLAAAFAHCATRYLYNCPENRFKIADDKSASVWSQWGD